MPPSSARVLSLTRWLIGALCALALLAGCGHASSPPTGPTVTSSPRARTELLRAFSRTATSPYRSRVDFFVRPARKRGQHLLMHSVGFVTKRGYARFAVWIAKSDWIGNAYKGGTFRQVFATKGDAFSRSPGRWSCGTDPHHLWVLPPPPVIPFSLGLSGAFPGETAIRRQPRSGSTGPAYLLEGMHRNQEVRSLVTLGGHPRRVVSVVTRSAVGGGLYILHTHLGPFGPVPRIVSPRDCVTPHW